MLLLLGGGQPAEARVFAAGGRAVAAARQSPRILYASSWTGRMEIFAVDPSGKAPVGQLTFGTEGCPEWRGVLPSGYVQPVPSPDGRYVLYRCVPPWKEPSSVPPGKEVSFWVARADGRAPRRLVAASWPGDNWDAAWSPDSKRIVYSRGRDGLHVVRPDGSGDRVIFSEPVRTFALSPDGRSIATLAYSVATGSWVPTDLYLRRGGRKKLLSRDVGDELAWSPNGRWIATWDYRPDREILLTAVSGAQGPQVGVGVLAAWSPDGRRLAYEAPDGLRVFDLRTRRSELLTRETAYERRDYRDRPLGLAWAPDGRSVAYVAGSLDFERGIESGDLRIVTLSGQVRTIVDADRAYGGRIVSLAWTQPPRTLRYQTPEPAPPTRVTPESALAPGPISRLAADGSRVAFVACQGVFVWTPAIGELTALLESDPLSRCLRRDYFSVGYSFAIAGDRVAYGEYSGNCVLTATLRLEVLEPSRMSAELARRSSSCGSPSAGVGWAAGAGDLLVFSTWKETCPFPPGCERYVTTSQQINRVGPGGCPCPAVASTPGPLIPADVDGGRIVAFGENATVLLDREGNTLLTLPVSPLAAQLSDTDVVLVLRGQLRHYDARSGALLHAWPLPDSVGARCELRCVPGGLFPRLLIEDLARGLIAYVDEGRVHLLRLSDGADAIVASGADARFIDKGLVYADGSRLHLVPFPALPLRSFARSTTNGNDSDQSEVLSGR